MRQHREPELAQHLLGLDDVIRLIPHRRQDAGDGEAVVDLAHVADLLHDVRHPAQAKRIELNRDDDLVRRHQRRGRSRIERRRAVDDHSVVPVVQLRGQLTQAHGGGAAGLDLRQIEVHQAVVSRQEVDAVEPAVLDARREAAQHVGEGAGMHRVALEKLGAVALAVRVH